MAVERHFRCYIQNTMEEKEKRDLGKDFYYLFKKYAFDKALTTHEQLFMIYVDFFTQTGGGLYAKNDWFRKEMNWDNQRTSDVIAHLLKKKRIMIWRKSKHSPDRVIVLYDRNTISHYKDGSLPNKYTLDYCD